MLFSKDNSSGNSSGVGALAILKVLLEIMQKKQFFTKEEVDIIINCAEVEVDSTDVGGSASEAKFLIHNLMKQSDDTTRGYDGSTG